MLVRRYYVFVQFIYLHLCELISISFHFMTILEENQHSFLIVEHDPLLYEDAEKRMVEYLAQAQGDGV